MSSRQYPSLNDNDDNDGQPVPLHRRDDDHTNCNEGYRELDEVRNSLPPPRNPNRDDGGQEDD